MHFATVAASAALVGSALAGYYETAEYYTTSAAAGYQTYTSVSTCTGKEAKPTYGASSSAPVYEVPTSSAPVYGSVSSAPAEVTYTSYAHVTVTSCAAYVTNCPAKTYTSAVYSVSTCTEGNGYVTPTGYSAPTTVPYYQPPSNYSSVPVYVPPTTTPCTTEVPVYTSSAPVSYTTVYTTVCPGANYCYGTTVTTTYCPTSTPVAVYTPPVYTPPPTYTSVTPPCNGYNCPSNNTTPTYTAPPSYTGAASSNAMSFGLAGVAAVVALFIGA